MRAITHRTTGRAILIHNKTAGLAAWRGMIANAAREARKHENGMLDGPVAVTLRFHLPIPRSRPKVLRTDKQRAEWAFPSRRPDLSKLIRAAEDALIGVLIRDDSQIVRMITDKIYSDSPGAEITIAPMA